MPPANAVAPSGLTRKAGPFVGFTQRSYWYGRPGRVWAQARKPFPATGVRSSWGEDRTARSFTEAADAAVGASIISSEPNASAQTRVFAPLGRVRTFDIGDPLRGPLGRPAGAVRLHGRARR